MHAFVIASFVRWPSAYIRDLLEHSLEEWNCELALQILKVLEAA